MKNEIDISRLEASKASPIEPIEAGKAVYLKPFPLDGCRTVTKPVLFLLVHLLRLRGGVAILRKCAIEDLSKLR